MADSASVDVLVAPRPARDASPAGVKQAVTVGATGRQDKKPAFSNHGSALDPFAPGVSITSASAAGDTARATSSGTSAASPHVAGAAALYLAEHRRAAPAQVADALVKGAASGKAAGRGPGSPDRLLQVPRAQWRPRGMPGAGRRGRHRRAPAAVGACPPATGSVPCGRGRSCVSTYA